MMRPVTLPHITAGLLSASVLVLMVGIGFGAMLLFLSSIPLFYHGLRHPSLYPALIASAIITGLLGLAPAAFYFLLLGLPAYYLCVWTARCEDGVWYPVGLALMRLAVAACAFIALLFLFYTTQDQPLHQILGAHINESFQELQRRMDLPTAPVHPSIVFMVLSVTVWLWVLMLYGCACVSHALLARSKTAIRPTLHIKPFTMPVWMLQLLGICALASLIGSPGMQFLGSSTLLALMLPYGLLGAALMHEACKDWPNRKFFLFSVYLLLILFFWPALMLSTLGLWQQIKPLITPEKSKNP